MLQPERSSLAKLLLAPVVLAALLSCPSAASAAMPRQEDASCYLSLVKRYADALIEYGADNFGTKHSGMILSLMDRSTLRPFSTMPGAPHGVRPGDRVTTHGSNVNLDQNMYRVLYALAEITGDKKYRKAADAALSEFLAATPSPETRLFAWGEHLCWDLKTDAWGAHGSKATHEPKRPTVLFDTLYRLNAKAMIDHCDGVWEHQIFSHQDGNFSRHARYDAHGPGKDMDFPKEGGYFINDWARAYQKTGASRFLDYIDVLASRYLGKMKTTTKNLIAFDSVRGYADTSSSISLAIDCHEAAGRLSPGRVRDKLLLLAGGIDEGLQALPHELKGPGFVQYVTVEDDYKLYEHKKNGGYSFTWNMKYGRKTTAMLGVLFYTRYTQLGAGGQKDKYKEMVLQAADKYMSTDPNMEDRPWPVEIGIATFLQLAVYELTGKQDRLDRAKHFADLGISTYWSGNSPLPKADPECNQYENITRADTLAYALLKIHVLEKSLPVAIDISDIDR